MIVARARSRRWRAVVALAGTMAGALLGTACGHGLLLADDARLTIVSPRSLSTVSAPVQVSWRTTIPPDSRVSYAVFVDVLPVHPGQNLRAVAGARCAGVPTCVDEALLNRHAVYLTRRPRLDLDTLPILGTPKGQRDMHQITIVLVDPSWQRLGESSWSVTFALRHAPQA